MIFQSRFQAGQKLAAALAEYQNQRPVVFAVPRGGVEIGAEVARQLEAPLELLVACKIRHPLYAELAIGAVTETGAPVWGEDAAATNEAWREHQVELARAEARRRHRKYLSHTSAHGMRGRTAILVDDGAATGLTIVAALRDILKRRPKSIIVGLPVASAEASLECANYADRVVALRIPDTDFGAVGDYYEDFTQVSDEKVRGLLGAYRRTRPDTEMLDLAALNSVLAGVGNYPVTSEAVAQTAKRLHAPAGVVQFFETIPGGTEFANKNEIILRAESAEILMEDAAEEPREQLRSYD